MMSYSNKLHNSSFQSNGGVNDGGSSGDDGDDGLAGDGHSSPLRLCTPGTTGIPQAVNCLTIIVKALYHYTPLHF